MTLWNRSGAALLTLALGVLFGGCSIHIGVHRSGPRQDFGELTDAQRSSCSSLESHAPEIRVAVEKAIADIGITRPDGDPYRLGRLEFLLDELSEAVDVCACCVNPPRYACCHYAGCDPCAFEVGGLWARLP